MSKATDGPRVLESRADRVAAALREAPPPLDELTRARMERELLAGVAAGARAVSTGRQPDEREKRQWGRWALAGGMLAAAASALLLAWPAEGPTTEALAPIARFEVRELASASRRGTLEAGSTLSTERGEEAELDVEASRVRLGPETRLRVATLLPDRWALELSAGEVRVEYHPRAPGQQRLSIETPQARVEVIGTVFTVRAEGDITEVAVTEGVVRVQPHGGGPAHTLRVGDRVRVGEPLEARVASSSAEALAVVPRPTRVGGGEPTGSVAAPSIVAAGSTAPPAEALDPERALTRARDRLAAGDAASAAPVLRSLARGQASPRVRAQAWTLLADLAEREGELDEAAEAFEHAARLGSGTSTGPNAIYALARLEERRRHDTEAAARSYRRYLEVAPRGPLAPQARAALCRLGDAAECVEAR